MSNITTDFIAATKKIHADVRAILTHIKLIYEDIRGMREAAISPPKNDSANNKTQKPENPEPNGTAPEGHLNSGKPASQETNSEQHSQSGLSEFLTRLKENTRKPKFWIEVGALLGLIAYTCETRRTNDLTERALKNSKDQFIKSQEFSGKQFQSDQRPYIWPVLREPEKPPKPGEPIRVNVFFINYGKTPAIRERSQTGLLVFFGEGTMPQADKFFSTFDEKSLVGADASEIIVPPGIPPDVAKGASAYTTAESKPLPKDQKVLDEIRNTDGSYAVVGVVLYEDGLGGHYRSDFCSMHLHTGSMMWCTRHNEIH